MLSRSNILRSFFLISSLLVALQFSPGVTAQEEVTTARKLDEFSGSSLSSCDYGARLDNLAIELQNNPDADGYIICYGPDGKGSGGGSFRLNVTKDYLVNTRGIDEARIKTLYGGRYKELREVFTELWVVPQKANPPEPVSYENNSKTFTGMFAEYVQWDGPYEGEGIPRGNVVLAAFADLLREQPETGAYLVVESMKNAAPGAWRRAAKEISASLQSDYEINADRIKIICAGYDAREEDAGQAKVQLWILPKDAPSPAVEVTEPEPKPEVAVRWRMFGVYELADADDKREVFEAFADVLRSNKELSVCIVVYQESAPPQIPELDAATIEQEKESGSEAVFERKAEFKLPNVDLMKLAGDWQSDLAKEYGISQQRLTIITASPEKWNYGMMEIWIVPPGAALPDPNQDNSVDTDGVDDADVAQPETPEAEPQEGLQ